MKDMAEYFENYVTLWALIKKPDFTPVFLFRMV